MAAHISLRDDTGLAKGLKPHMKRAALYLAKKEGWGNFAVNVWVTDDDSLRELNKEYRGLNQTTDVLSFSMQEEDEEGMLQAGDIAISVEAAKRRSPLPIRQEIVRLFIHGLLHCFGHDHHRAKPAAIMHALTDEAFVHSGVTDE